MSKKELTTWEEVELCFVTDTHTALKHHTLNKFLTYFCVLTVAAEVTVFVVDSLGVSGDLLDLTVVTQTHHVVGFLELVRTVQAAHKDDLVLQRQSCNRQSDVSASVTFYQLSKLKMAACHR